MTDLLLSDRDRTLLAGSEGPGTRLAMEVIVEMAAVTGASRLIDIESAHIDGCLPFGRVALDLPRRLIDGGAHVAVPTTLNVAAVDLLHPERPSGDPVVAELGREIASAYEELGCRPTWTCAPYQLPSRPSAGSHVAWAESNAIVFANSVLGARTGRYGDFFDICAAVAGRVPDAGLHRTPDRAARATFHLDDLTPTQLADDLLFPLLGTFIGRHSGSLVPAITGLPAATEDQLKALGAAAASAGAVAMFHAVGITPEAPTLMDALQGRGPVLAHTVRAQDLRDVRRELGAAVAGPLTAIALGTPHLSVTEFESLRAALRGRSVADGVAAYVSTSRAVLETIEERGWRGELEAQGVSIVVDTCTYLRPLVDLGGGTVLTNSAKWAWYAPMTLGVDVIIGSLHECVESAVVGHPELSDVF